MKQKTKYAVVVFKNSDNAEKISYVTSLDNEANNAHWEKGKDAKLFESRDFAREIAFGLCLNGYPAAVMEVPSYLTLKNEEEEDISSVDTVHVSMDIVLTDPGKYDEIKKWEQHIDYAIDFDGYPEIDYIKNVEVSKSKTVGCSQDSQDVEHAKKHLLSEIDRNSIIAAIDRFFNQERREMVIAGDVMIKPIENGAFELFLKGTPTVKDVAGNIVFSSDTKASEDVLDEIAELLNGYFGCVYQKRMND